MCNLHFAIHQGSPSFYIFTHEKIIMSFAITDLLLNTGVFKIPAIVRLYQIQTPLRAKMLEIDTILRTVCIVEKSIYSGGLANVGRMPAFFML